MFERVLNTPLQLYLFHAFQLKKCEDKAYQYKSVQRFFREHTYMKHILILIPYNSHTKN